MMKKTPSFAKLVRNFSFLPAFFFFLVSLTLGGAAAFWGHTKLEKAQSAYQTSRERWDRATRELEQSAQNQREEKALFARFQALEKKGALNRDFYLERLEWKESLDKARQRHALPAMRYEFQARRPLTEDKAANPARFWVTPMSLTLELNHEMEWPAFLETLQTSNPAILRTKECEMTPNAVHFKEIKPGPNILAHCQMEWLTVEYRPK